ncbi:hypothetical protein [Mangrovimonas futianensis]|uniref:hypothetical protein n=1 Tax=Mangrovimonas futianensis TaxID=2895523 RepID=UPI001E3D6D64|nr:hypothetical protein [Mangrovimonas futianensis]MCF1420439.1 hypothetical protein [Mangrovimonas futianensis]
MEKFKGLNDAIRASIEKVNETAQVIESIEQKIRDGEITVDSIGEIQLSALRKMHQRYINDVETYKADLEFFKSIENL